MEILDKHINSQLDLLFFDLMEFYKNHENLEKFKNIITGGIQNISLRLIDWFSTNYAKKCYTVINSTDDGRRFKVFDSYKLKLRAYGKDNFDAFSRGKRISIPYCGEMGEIELTTTIGQMNFSKWLIENQIVEYILDNLEEIKKDMDSRSSNSKKKKDVLDDSGKTRKKREELSVCATKCIIKEKVSITIKFSI
jgi:hypothetical protein